MRAVWRVPYDRRQIVCFGIFGMLSVQYTYFVTILYSNAATATILQYLMPIVMVCYIALRHRKRPSLLELVSVALAMFGVLYDATQVFTKPLARASRRRLGPLDRGRGDGAVV